MEQTLPFHHENIDDNVVEEVLSSDCGKKLLVEKTANLLTANVFCRNGQYHFIA